MGPLQRSEGLWRDVYFRREKTAIENRRVNRDSKAAFGRPPYSEISVSRYDAVELAECTEAGNRRAEPIKGAEGVLGWVIIPGDIAIRGGRQAEADPTSDNCYHANIVLPAVVASWQDTEVHTREFVVNGRWQDAV